MSPDLPNDVAPEDVIHSQVAKTLKRDKYGHFVKEGSESPSVVSTEGGTSSGKGDPPLVSFKVTNPVTYLKLWWKRIMANEGIDFRFRVKPITAIAIALILFSFWFGLGGVLLPSLYSIFRIPNNPYVPTPTNAPTPTINPWRETALTGTLKQTENTKQYYLVVQSTEAVTLQFNKDVDLSKYIGKRILASGNYNSKTHTLVISDVLDLEVLPTKAVQVTVNTPTPTPTLTPAEIPSTTPTY